MGVYYSTYVGPYLKVPGITTETEVTQYTCSAGCKKKHRAGHDTFCSGCGQPVKATTAPVQEFGAMQYSDMPEAFEDALSRASIDGKQDESVWMPNTMRVGYRFSHEEETGTYELNATKMDSEVAKFTKHYATLIKAIQTQYGVTPIVCFGVVTEGN